MNTSTLKGKTTWVMTNREQARNDDNFLVISLWLDFYQINRDFPINDVNRLYELIQSLPKADDIVRCRRKIQSEQLLLPTDPRVIELRKRKEKTFPIDLGYH